MKFENDMTLEVIKIRINIYKQLLNESEGIQIFIKKLISQIVDTDCDKFNKC